MARGGPDALARGQRGEPQEPAGSREGGEAPPDRQPAVRAVVPRDGRNALPQLVQRPLRDRLDGRPRRGEARGRAELLPDPLRAEQRRSRHRGRFRAERGSRLGREALRAHPPAGAARSPGPDGSRRRGDGGENDAGQAREGPGRADRLESPGQARPLLGRDRSPLESPRRRRVFDALPDARQAEADRGLGPRRLRRERRAVHVHGLHRRATGRGREKDGRGSRSPDSPDPGKGRDGGELARARALYKSERFSTGFESLQTPLGRAEAIGWSALFDPDGAEGVNSDVARYDAVVPADIQEAARKSFVLANRSVIEIVPAAKASAAPGGAK